MKWTAIALFLLTGCVNVDRVLQNYPHDNFIEEELEEYIQENTGLDIDLSITSPEKD